MGRELETARLLLRPSCVEDSERVHALWADERVRLFLFDGRAISPDEARSFIEESVSNFEDHGYGLWLVFERRRPGRLVGFAGLLRSDGESPNLLYGIHPDFWGRGYATEAAGAVLRYAAESLSVARVRADVDEPNVASVRVLEKLGMRCVGRAVVTGRPLLYFERPSTAGAD
jgi:ribosomal-protein-alanine N-acetyltransferase